MPSHQSARPHQFSPDDLDDIADEVFGDLEEEYGLGGYLATLQDRYKSQGKVSHEGPLRVPGTPSRRSPSAMPMIGRLALALGPFSIEGPTVVGGKVHAALKANALASALKQAAGFAKSQGMVLVMVTSSDMTSSVIRMTFEFAPFSQ